MCFRIKNRKPSLEVAPPTLAQKNSTNTENNPPLLLRAYLNTVGHK